MKTGTIIKDLRIKKGLTQEELANKTEVSVRTIQRIENGDVDPRAYTLQMLAKALEVDYSIFIDTTTEETNVESNKDKIILAFLHLSGILIILLPSFLIWNKHKHNVSNISTHFGAVIGFQLTCWMLILMGFIQYYIVRMPYMFYAAALFTIFFSVMNTISVLNNQSFKYMNLIRVKGESFG